MASLNHEKTRRRGSAEKLAHHVAKLGYGTQIQPPASDILQRRGASESCEAVSPLITTEKNVRSVIA